MRRGQPLSLSDLRLDEVRQGPTRSQQTVQYCTGPQSQQEEAGCFRCGKACCISRCNSLRGSVSFSFSWFKPVHSTLLFMLVHLVQVQRLWKSVAFDYDSHILHNSALRAVQL